MKILPSAFIAIACSAGLVLAESITEKAEAFFQQGLAEEKAGNPTAAVSAYKKAIELNPKHANARYRAGQVQIHAPTIKAKAQEQKINTIMIPAYQIEDATLKEAIELLALAIEKHSEDKTAPNFIVEDPTKKLAEAKLTLNLKNVPVSAILKYIHAQTRTKIRYDEHAVVILAR
jgi:tetratricopeptide (TPR) repeat protein